MLLFWALVFLVVALIAAIFALELVVTGAAWVAQLFFLVFITMALVAFLSNLFRPRVP